MNMRFFKISDGLISDKLRRIKRHRDVIFFSPSTNANKFVRRIIFFLDKNSRVLVFLSSGDNKLTDRSAQLTYGCHMTSFYG